MHVPTALKILIKPKMFSIKRNVVDEPLETVEIEIVQAREKIPEMVKTSTVLRKISGVPHIYHENPKRFLPTFGPIPGGF